MGGGSVEAGIGVEAAGGGGGVAVWGAEGVAGAVPGGGRGLVIGWGLRQGGVGDGKGDGEGRDSLGESGY